MNEIRPATVAAETRADGAMVLRGYAARYDVETVIGGMFREVIKPGAFTRALLEQPDVLALYNHNPDYVLGRVSNQTLTLGEDAQGLRYEVVLNPDDDDAKKIHAKVKRGDIKESSFAFAVAPNGQRFVREDGALPLRELTDLNLYDVSAVAQPAYPQTSVTARDLLAATETAADVLAARAAADVVPVRVRRLELNGRA
jgi:HK97 family phage prohead protease